MKHKTICIIKNLFGIDCAGCGTTRMFKAILSLDFYQAFRYNPFMFSLICVSLLYLIYVIIMKLLKKKIWFPKVNSLYVFLVLIILFMILRNVPGFEFLLPTEV